MLSEFDVYNYCSYWMAMMTTKADFGFSEQKYTILDYPKKFVLRSFQRPLKTVVMLEN